MRVVRNPIPTPPYGNRSTPRVAAVDRSVATRAVPQPATGTHQGVRNFRGSAGRGRGPRGRSPSQISDSLIRPLHYKLLVGDVEVHITSVIVKNYDPVQCSEKEKLQ